MNIRYIVLVSLFVFLSILKTTSTLAQQNIVPEPLQKTYEGTVEQVTENNGTQNIKVKITNKDKVDQTVQISTGQTTSVAKIEYKVSDKVFLLQVTDPVTKQVSYYITDFDRTNSLMWLFVLFCFVVVLVSKKWGVYSILGMLYSFLVIFKFILPQLLNGHNPLFIAILGALFIAPVTFYLSHGVNQKTTSALISTVIALFITGILSLIFINVSKLTGFGTDEAFFLQIAKDGVINMRGIFLAGIIIGTLGILDDVTVSQSSIVYQLRTSVRGLEGWELYKKAMAVGHDHIASAVNTLVLVYTGAALPLLLLFINSSKTFGEAINAEIIADEIARTLIGSIGLVLAVPISTVLAVFLVTESDHDSHRHHSH